LPSNKLLRARLPGFLGGIENILLDFDNFGHGATHLTFVEGRSRLQGNSWISNRFSLFFPYEDDWSGVVKSSPDQMLARINWVFPLPVVMQDQDCGTDVGPVKIGLAGSVAKW
jgi:hypothetical protein